MPHDDRPMTDVTTTLPARYAATGRRLADYAARYGRDPAEIRLLAVSKRHGGDKILQLCAAGQYQFGENQLQEATAKIAHCHAHWHVDDTSRARAAKIVWHFIGTLQSRKCREIVKLFDWVHTVDNYKVATKLHQHRRPDQPLNVLIQLNLQNEPSKSGIALAELPRLAAQINELSHLKLRGLMIIPRHEHDFAKQRAVFAECRTALRSLPKMAEPADQLSMGMSADMEAAIAEGATQIRIGTAIFGPRPTHPSAR